MTSFENLMYLIAHENESIVLDEVVILISKTISYVMVKAKKKKLLLFYSIKMW